MDHRRLLGRHLRRRRGDRRRVEEAHEDHVGEGRVAQARLPVRPLQQETQCKVEVHAQSSMAMEARLRDFFSCGEAGQL